MALSVVEERRSTVSCHKTAYGHSRIVLLIVQSHEPTISAHIANRYLLSAVLPLKLHLTTSELWFGQEQEGILRELHPTSGIV